MSGGCVARRMQPDFHHGLLSAIERAWDGQVADVGTRDTGSSGMERGAEILFAHQIDTVYKLFKGGEIVLKRIAAAAALWLVIAGGVARAQEIALTGTVTDATGGVLPGATVTARHVESGSTFLGVTDAAGQYRIGAMRPGGYAVTAELSGFAAVKRENLDFLLGQRATLDFKLGLSGVQETVTVTSASPLVELTQSRLGDNIDRRQMEELPVNGRNWLGLVTLAKGSRVNAADNSPAALSAVSGLDNPGNFQINLDGQQVTGTIAQASTGEPKFSRDAIGEFEILTSRFDATQGRSMGVQVNAVTKSGTNAFAGSAGAYFRDDKFNAKDFVVNRVLPYSNQQVSGTFGGPIKKDVGPLLLLIRA